MNTFRLLIVEDDEQDLRTCQDTVDRYMNEKQRKVEIVECRSLKEAYEKLDNSIDGAIIDLKLDNQGDEGNHVVGRIKELNFRIPVAILTGTPNTADSDFAYIGVFKKGDPEAGYADLVDRLWRIHNIGLTRIMGGRGIVEETMYKVFQENLLPQIDKWLEYGEMYGVTKPSRTEKALLRHTLNHLLQLLDEDGDNSFPEEVYLYPPLTKKISTGSIVEQKDGNWFAVMNPACDLVIREKGSYKTDRILLVEIESENEVVHMALVDVQKAEKKKSKLVTVFGNNYTNYYHWLPKTNFFPGGFLNFRKLSTFTKDEISKKFETPKIQISPLFVKDVVARFSSYYARQGQPDIEYVDYIARLTSAQEAMG